MDHWLEMQLRAAEGGAAHGLARAAEGEAARGSASSLSSTTADALSSGITSQPSCPSAQHGTKRVSAKAAPKPSPRPAKRARKTTQSASRGAARAVPAPMAAPHWQDNVKEPLKHVRAARGEQLRDVLVGSMFSGAMGERVCLDTVGVAAKFIFSMDIKPTSFRFIESNHGVPTHHFCDAREFLNGSTSGRCAAHGFSKCSLRMAKRTMDILLAGVSCRPFSTARQARFQGTQDHEDSQLMESWFNLMVELEPLNGIVENVFGFILPESTRDRSSPISRFLEVVKERLPAYNCTVLILDAKTFLCFSRVRVWIVCQHREVVGADAGPRMVSLVQAVVHARRKLPPLKAEDIMLKDDDPRVVEHIAKAAKRTHKVRRTYKQIICAERVFLLVCGWLFELS